MSLSSLSLGESIVLRIHGRLDLGQVERIRQAIQKALEDRRLRMPLAQDQLGPETKPPHHPRPVKPSSPTKQKTGALPPPPKI